MRARPTATSNVLSIPPFRRLWIATSLSSLGDWLSLLALPELVRALGDRSGSLAATIAPSSVWLVSMLPALLLGPLAGAVADRMDRRVTMILGDVVRAALYLSIPLDLALGFANKLTWMFTAQFLASCASLFWGPAKDASVPNLVPREKLEQANQYSLLTTYGTALPAALVVILLSGLGGVVGLPTVQGQVGLVLYLNVATFIVSAAVAVSLPITRRTEREHISSPSVVKIVWEGWRFIGQAKVVRGIAIGMAGAFAGAGVVIGLGPVYIQATLSGGKAAVSVVFAAVFLGLAAGMFLGLRVLRGFSRRRLFGVSIVSAGVLLILVAATPSLTLVYVWVLLLGAFAGMAYVTGYTIVGQDVDDDTRGRTFSFLQSGVRVLLVLAMTVALPVSLAVTALFHRLTGRPTLTIGRFSYGAVGSNATLLLAAGLVIWLGVVSYRLMDDRKGVRLRDDFFAALFGTPFTPAPVPAGAALAPSAHPGTLIVLAGTRESGATSQARSLTAWMRAQGYDVVAPHESPAARTGMRLRALLADTVTAEASAPARALLHAAHWAEHVDSLITPALAQGALVVWDHELDSPAHDGPDQRPVAAGLAWLRQWATGGMTPDLTIWLDMRPATGLPSGATPADPSPDSGLPGRAPDGFHDAATPQRHLVLDATRPADELTGEIQAWVRAVLPGPPPAGDPPGRGR